MPGLETGQRSRRGLKMVCVHSPHTRQNSHSKMHGKIGMQRAGDTHQFARQPAHELQVPIDVVYVAKSRVLKKLREEILALAEDLPQCVPLA
jgi:hypothetical protein